MSEPPPATPAVKTVGGDVRRISIVTIRENPCASYLARRLRDCGAAIDYFSQARLKVEPRSRAYFARLYRKRGLATAADNLLLYAAYLTREGLRGITGSAPDDDAALPALRPDPDLRKEPWLRFHEIEDVNSEDGRRALAAASPDLVLLGGAPILGRRAIGIARLACINPHCGITPRYAGGSPSTWAIYEGRFDDVGYTIHLVDPVVDSGPILAQERIDWDPTRSTAGLWPILAQAMYDRLAEIATRLVAGETLGAAPQPPVHVRPPAGLIVRSIAELRRKAYARRRRSPRPAAS